MATPPTVLTYKNADASFATGTATRVLTQISVTTGDTVAVVIATEDFAGTGTLTVTKTAGTSVIGTITTRQDAGTTNHCGLALFTFPVTTGGTLTLTVTRSVTSAQRRATIMTYVGSSCGGVGVTAKTTTSTTTITASINPAANSYIGVYAADWSAVGGSTTTLTPVGGALDVHETDGVQDQVAAGTIYSSRAGHWANSSAGIASYGVTVPTSSGYNLVAFELLAAATPTAVTPPPIIGTVTFGYAGVVGNAAPPVTVIIGRVRTTIPTGYLGGYRSGYGDSITLTIFTGVVAGAQPITASAILPTTFAPSYLTFIDSAGTTDTSQPYTVVVDEAITEYVGVEDQQDQFWIAYGEELTDTDALADVVSESATSTSPQPDAVVASATVATPTIDTTVDPRPAVITTTALVGSLQVQQDRTIAPAIVAATGSLPTVQVRQDRTIAISGRVATATTVPALAPAVGSVVASTAILGHSTVAGQTVRRDARPTAAAITSVATVPTATVTAVLSGNPAPDVIPATVTVPFPAVSAGVTVAAVQTSTTIATAVAAASSTATPAALSPTVGVRIPAAAITAERATTVAAAPITTVASVGALPPELGQTAEPDIIAGTCIIPEPVPAADSTATTVPIVATATAGELTVSQNVEIPADVITTASTVTTAALQTGTTVTAEIVSVTIAFAEYATAVSQNITADVVTTATTIVQPDEITHAADIPAAVLSTDAGVLTPNIYTVPDHPPVINPTLTRTQNRVSRLTVRRGTGMVRVPASAVQAMIARG